MTTNEYLKAFCAVYPISFEQHKPYQMNRPYAVCADGFGISLQASDCLYCEPRISQFPEKDFVPYKTIELGYPTEADEDLLRYQECPGKDDPTETVYGYVPVEVIDKVLEKHGGIDIAKTRAYFGKDILLEDFTDPWWPTMHHLFDDLIKEEIVNGLPIKTYTQFWHKHFERYGFNSEKFLGMLKTIVVNDRMLTEDEIRKIYDYVITLY